MRKRDKVCDMPGCTRRARAGEHRLWVLMRDGTRDPWDFCSREHQESSERFLGRMVRVVRDGAEAAVT